jgi:hypothetical protein
MASVQKLAGSGSTGDTHSELYACLFDVLLQVAVGAVAAAAAAT